MSSHKQAEEHLGPFNMNDREIFDFLTHMGITAAGKIKEVQIKFDLKTEDADSEFVNDKLGKYVTRWKPDANVLENRKGSSEPIQDSPNIDIIKKALDECNNGFIITGAGFEGTEITTLSQLRKKLEMATNDEGLESIVKDWAREFIVSEPTAATEKIAELTRESKKIRIVSLNASVSLEKASPRKDSVFYIFKNEVNVDEKGEIAKISLMSSENIWNDLDKAFHDADLVIYVGMRFQNYISQHLLKLPPPDCPKIFITGIEKLFDALSSANERENQIGNKIHDPLSQMHQKLALVLTDKAERIFSDYYQI